MTAYFIHQHQSRAMEPRRPGRNAMHNYPLRLTAPILANYYVEVRFDMSLGVKKKKLFFSEELSNFFWLDIVFYMHPHFDLLRLDLLCVAIVQIKL